MAQKRKTVDHTASTETLNFNLNVKGNVKGETGNVRFYSLPPRHLYYPYLLVNINRREELRKRNFEHAILDSGVELFKNKPGLTDYPKSFLWRYKQIAEIVTRQNRGKVWITIPDYPDDFNPGQFGDNVEKTLKNIEQFISFEGIEWLPVIQSRYLNRFSFFESCQRLHKLIGDYPRVAIGTVYKTHNLPFIIYCCKVARKFFPKSWIHAFGPALTAVPKIKDYIDSWDSLACYYPRTTFKEWTQKTGLKPFPNAKPFPRSKQEEFFFKMYLRRIEELGVSTAN